MSGRVVILRGDAAHLPLPDSSVDAVVCDPPYGLEFMGREWDTFRTGDGFRRSRNEADAGRDSVFGRTSRTSPEYSTGKPSAARIRERVDGRTNPAEGKSVTRTPEAYVAGAVFGEWCGTWAAECLRVLKPGGYLAAFGGTRTYHWLACGIETAGFEIRDSLHWLYGSGFPKGQACLKPAHEPIVLARKRGPRSAPLPGLDACRIVVTDPDYAKNASGDRGHADNRARSMGFGITAGSASDIGRWPPNVLLGEEVAAELDRQTTATRAGKPSKTGTAGAAAEAAIYGAGGGLPRNYAPLSRDDSGGASRFFPVFRYEPKADASERPRLADGTAWPTVKPVALMQWLVRLVTPPGGTVLDLFAGTGTTGEACAVEGLDCILLDRDPQALALTRVRLAKPVQPVLFGDLEAS